MMDAMRPHPRVIQGGMGVAVSNWRLAGADFTFPEGSIILPGGFLVVASDANVFAQTYGSSIPVAGQYLGNLQNNGRR